MDNGQPINVNITSSSFKMDLESQSDSRVVLGFLSARYQTDADITAVVYFRRDDDMVLEQTTPIILSATEQRYYGQLPQGLNVIDFYVVLMATPSSTFEVTSLKVHIKTLPAGKFG
jgi:hypothetical protein